MVDAMAVSPIVAAALDDRAEQRADPGGRREAARLADARKSFGYVSER
jgi:hypothetical protein